MPRTRKLRAFCLGEAVGRKRQIGKHQRIIQCFKDCFVEKLRRQCYPFYSRSTAKSSVDICKATFIPFECAILGSTSLPYRCYRLRSNNRMSNTISSILGKLQVPRVRAKYEFCLQHGTNRTHPFFIFLSRHIVVSVVVVVAWKISQGRHHVQWRSSRHVYRDKHSRRNAHGYCHLDGVSSRRCNDHLSSRHHEHGGDLYVNGNVPGWWWWRILLVMMVVRVVLVRRWIGHLML
jgi:hypothetical protein